MKKISLFLMTLLLITATTQEMRTVHYGRATHSVIDLRSAGEDAVHTYRIPGLVTTPKGTLLAIYDVRYEAKRDLQGHMDIGLSRSSDKGKSWEPMKIIMDMGTYDGLPEKLNGCSDANILVDTVTGRIFVFAAWMHGDFREYRGDSSWIHQWNPLCPGPGVSPHETTQFLMVYSDDDGLSWSTPLNLTEQIKNPQWYLLCPAPGRGITLKDGTLVVPVQGRDGENRNVSTIMTSNDRGITWQVGTPAIRTPEGTTECAVIERHDGSLMLNMRDNRNGTERFGRTVATTADKGATWQEHHTSGSKRVPTPLCMASLHKHHYTQHNQPSSVVLFFNPHSWNARKHFTLQVSFDDGESWSPEYRVLVDRKKGYGYSCITSVDEQTIGIIYESSGGRLSFLTLPLSEILTPRRGR